MAYSTLNSFSNSVPNANGVVKIRLKATANRGAGAEASASFTTNAPPETVTMMLLAGQSNAVGYAPVADLSAEPYASVTPAYTRQFQRVMIWSPTANAFEKLQVGVNQLGVNMANGKGLDQGVPNYTEGFGVEIGLAQRWEQENATGILYLVKYAKGATSISQWQPDQTLYNNLVSYVSNAKAWLTAQGKTSAVKGMYWMQGESDTATVSATYTSGLTNFFNGLVSSGILPANARRVIGQARNSIFGRGIDQENYVLEDPVNRAFIETEYYTNQTISDGLHYDAPSMLKNGYSDVYPAIFLPLPVPKLMREFNGPIKLLWDARVSPTLTNGNEIVELPALQGTAYKGVKKTSGKTNATYVDVDGKKAFRFTNLNSPIGTEAGVFTLPVPTTSTGYTVAMICKVPKGPANLNSPFPSFFKSVGDTNVQVSLRANVGNIGIHTNFGNGGQILENYGIGMWQLFVFEVKSSGGKYSRFNVNTLGGNNQINNTAGTTSLNGIQFADNLDIDIRTIAVYDKPIDTGHVEMLIRDFNRNFPETGLPAGTSWGDSANRVYSGFTGYEYASYYSDGHASRYSAVIGEYYEQTDSGTQIQIYSPKSAGAGSFEVYVDGISKGTFSANNATILNATLITTITGLSAGTHTLRVVNRGGGSGNVLLSDKVVFS